MSKNIFVAIHPKNIFVGPHAPIPQMAEVANPPVWTTTRGTPKYHVYMKKEPLFLCRICSGPIGMGEPVVRDGEWIAHRFKTTCEHEKELQAKNDSEFLSGMGITSL